MDTDIKVYTVKKIKEILHVTQRTIYNYKLLRRCKGEEAEV